MKSLLAALAMLVSFAALAQPAPELHLALTSPLDFQIFQRSSQSNGDITIAGTTTSPSKSPALPDELKVRFTGDSPFGKLPEGWQSLPCDSRVAAFRATLHLPAGGWYRMELCAFRNHVQVASITIAHFGIGENFVVAGQSNSANYGEERQTAKSGLVAAFDGTAWRLAADPEPGAGGTKGSFMPLFGDAMAARFHVPIGIIATGIGSTSVREWLPAGTRLTRLPPLTRNVVTTGDGQWESSGKIFNDVTAKMKLLGTNGFRAVLWHQGESDAHQADPERTLPGELYRQHLEQLIRDSRAAIGWNAPWFVAQVSYHNPTDTCSPDIRAAQKAVCDDGLAQLGPDTDTLTGAAREKNGAGIHLSAKGLQLHADLWTEKVAPWLDKQLEQSNNP